MRLARTVWDGRIALKSFPRLGKIWVSHRDWPGEHCTSPFIEGLVTGLAKMDFGDGKQLLTGSHPVETASGSIWRVFLKCQILPL